MSEGHGGLWEVVLVLTFVFGYALITVEHPLKLSKSATAVLAGVICWAIVSISGMLPFNEVVVEVDKHLASIAKIVVFLLSAMAIVETISAHGGFGVVIRRLPASNPVALVWLISWISFFLSAVIDNMTTTIVIVTLVRSIFPASELRKYIAGLIVIAANAGGAFSPIGDVTTTMLWVGGQITALNIIKELFVPSVMCLLIPLLAFTILHKKKIKEELKISTEVFNVEIKPHGELIFYLGVGGLLFIPVFKEVTHLVPTFGAVLALGILWVITEIVHRKDPEREHLKVVNTIKHIDIPSLVFFIGILLAVGSLESTGFLHQLANFLDKIIPIKEVVLTIIGILSAIVDNIPLTAAVMGMYPLTTYPPDHEIWEFLAYAVGTGGSILVIGSAAGVVAMGIEKLEFFWYARKIGPWAFLGYIAGILTYLGIYALLGG